MGYIPEENKMTHVCERCRRNVELFYHMPVDEYLCEECIDDELVRAARDFARSRGWKL